MERVYQRQAQVVHGNLNFARVSPWDLMVAARAFAHFTTDGHNFVARGTAVCALSTSQ